MKNYFRRKDAMGFTPQMSYRGEDSYGTTIGGCCSCCARLFILVYVSVILIGFCFGRQYDALIQTHYLPLDDPEPYELTA